MGSRRDARLGVEARMNDRINPLYKPKRNKTSKPYVKHAPA
jgi:hypothetical protein